MLIPFSSFCFPIADGRNFTSVSILAAFTITFALIHLIWQLLKLCLLIVQCCNCDRGCCNRDRGCCKVNRNEFLPRIICGTIKKVNWKEFVPRTLYETIQFLPYIFSIAFAAIPSTSCPCISKGRWQIGALALFLAWVNAVTFIKLVPRLGVYVLMFQKVICSFLKMFILGMLLVVAFGLTFHMLFREPLAMVREVIPIQ